MTDKKAGCVAVFGTGSDVGKSLITAAICRIFSDHGLRVAPFKAQNMSNNSHVTADGGEIGRAQAVQAECARIEPTVHMNPLLLKPSGASVSQVVLRGKAVGNATSEDFRNLRARYFEETVKSLELLRSSNDIVVIEGAGSCAEVNLRGYDIANFRTATACDAPVILVADIDRGGVFAQVVGTLELLEENERELVKGIIINKFRGDEALFDDGRKFIERKTGVPVLGVVPFAHDIDIDAEDSLELDSAVARNVSSVGSRINIAALRLPRVSNFTDLAPLFRHPAVNPVWLNRVAPLDGVDMLILPGSKNTRADLMWLMESGWKDAIIAYAKRGGRVIGICGGYQMLGQSVDDPDGVEDSSGSTPGLGLLDVRTVMGREKRLAKVRGRWLATGCELAGYEIHMGVTELGEASALMEICDGAETRLDGAMSPDGKVWGTYLHGLFDEPEFLDAFIKGFGKPVSTAAKQPSAFEYRQSQYDKLASHFRKHVNINLLFEIAGINPDSQATCCHGSAHTHETDGAST
ncbi:MAG: cobyric acid synthase [Nitrospinae bacterium]|nr:cobyric acid synthase [Nitrospinota bacterium]